MQQQDRAGARGARPNCSEETCWTSSLDLNLVENQIRRGRPCTDVFPPQCWWTETAADSVLVAGRTWSMCKTYEQELVWTAVIVWTHSRRVFDSLPVTALLTYTQYFTVEMHNKRWWTLICQAVYGNTIRWGGRFHIESNFWLEQWKSF